MESATTARYFFLAAFVIEASVEFNISQNMNLQIVSASLISSRVASFSALNVTYM